MTTADSAQLPRDTDSQPIQTLAPSTSVHLDVTTSSQRVVFTAGTEIIRISSSVGGFIAFGDGTVTAADDGSDSFYFPLGVEIFKVPVGATNVAIIGDDTGEFTATRMI